MATDDTFETLSPPEHSGDDSGLLFTRTSDSRKARKVSARTGLSLKARAINILSRREHSRWELQKKLAPHTDDLDSLELLLNELEAQKWLSTERFADSLVNRRASSRGALRIVQELRQHGVADEHIAEVNQQLLATEADRALDVYKRKFPDLPETQKDYARHYRFLVGRGFTPDTIRRLLGAMPSASRF